jgi:hypothetical protein
LPTRNFSGRPIAPPRARTRCWTWLREPSCPPPEDQRRLIEAGVERVYTPKDYELTRIMEDIAELALARRA